MILMSGLRGLGDSDYSDCMGGCQDANDGTNCAAECAGASTTPAYPTNSPTGYTAATQYPGGMPTGAPGQSPSLVSSITSGLINAATPKPAYPYPLIGQTNPMIYLALGVGVIALVFLLKD